MGYEPILRTLISLHVCRHSYTDDQFRAAISALAKVSEEALKQQVCTTPAFDAMQIMINGAK